MLAKGKKLSLIATDDSHFRSDDFFGGWIEVKAKNNTPEELLASLKEGSFYSSQGPKIYDLNIYKERLSIKSSPVNSVILLGNGSSSLVKHDNSMTSTEIKFPKAFKSPWIRIVIVDDNGKKAWSNPIWSVDI